MDTASSNKKIYYRQNKTVISYDRLRFHSSGGKYVNSMELNWVNSFLEGVDRNSVILDVPTGTGRVSSYLEKNRFRNIYGVDSSALMLSAAKKKVKITKLIMGDANSLPFDSESVDAVICLRFFFHFNELEVYLNEINRVLRPNGILIFDTLNWSPRQLMGKLNIFFGGNLYIHKENKIKSLLYDKKLKLVSKKDIFTIPSYAYPYLPKSLLTFFIWVDKKNYFLKSKTIWKFSKKIESDETIQGKKE